MLFNSVAFLFFLPLTVILYYLLPQRFRWVWLLFASYYFYGSWNWKFLGLLWLTTLVDYYIAVRMEKEPDRRKKKRLLAVSIIANLGVLGFFKYANFFLDVVGYSHVLNVILPVGISFYTFQSMSYTIDVYRGNARAEHSLPRFSLFVSYFPQLVAGPIERFPHLNGQLRQHIPLAYENLSLGFRQLLYGFFIKICIADNTALYVDRFYSAHTEYGTADTWLAWALFGLQIYTDFYGYSLIAKGSARLLGVDLMDNFKNPYLSRSINEFWQRWHISLSTWFRDYLYIPLGGNRVMPLRWVLNIMIVFVLSGLWHGANYTFLIWGAIHGIIYLAERPVGKWTQKHTSEAKTLAGWIITYFSVHIAWVFFRSPDHKTAFSVIGQMFRSAEGKQHLDVAWPVWLLLGIFILCESVDFRKGMVNSFAKLNTPLRWAVYLALLFMILAMGGTANHPFIYFQF